MKNRSFIIAGPTASGKSDFAHELARRIRGVIINCDSVQIYRGIEIIAASPFAGRAVTNEIDGVPYRLFSVLDLSRQISVAEYLDMARAEYNAACDAGRDVIFVGGTGYYINAILNGISPMPDISDDVRHRARELVATDINAARGMLPPDFPFSDPQRVARGVEVFLQTGRHITEYQAAPRVGAISPMPVKILINPPAEVVATRIAHRAQTMISTGALEEGQRIIDSNWDTNRAIGAAQVCAYLRGEIDRAECMQNWTTKTRQYAKRQRTWFRTQFAADIEFNHTPTMSDIDSLV